MGVGYSFFYGLFTFDQKLNKPTYYEKTSNCIGHDRNGIHRLQPE